MKALLQEIYALLKVSRYVCNMCVSTCRDVQNLPFLGMQQAHVNLIVVEI
jgi:hypothetical protein